MRGRGIVIAPIVCAAFAPAASAADYPATLLQSVSCAAADYCMAVGLSETLVSPQPQDNNGQEIEPVASPFAESFNGSTWSQLASPGPVGARLTDVACPTTTTCVAIGTNGVNQNTGAQSVSFANEYTGAAFHQQRISTWIDALSCVSASWCLAVGNGEGTDNRSGRTSTTLTVERFDGRSWRRLPNVTIDESVEVNGVACATRDFCMVVGVYGRISTDDPFALLFNGDTWKIERVPTPRSGGELDAVSCSSVGECVAVGTAGTFAPGGERGGPHPARQPRPVEADE